MQQFVPIFQDEIGTDDNPDVLLERGIGVGLLKGMEFPALEITQSWCETLADQGEQGKDVVTSPAGVGEMLLDIEDGFVVEEAIEDVGSLTLS